MDTQDTSSSVLLFFDKQRFIFNAGEGLQRFCTEHKVKLSKLTSLYGGPLEFLLVVESTEDPAYHPVSRLISKFEGSLDARIVVASLTITCSKKIHNQLVGVEANMYCFWMMMLGYILDQLERSLVRWKRILRCMLTTIGKIIVV